MKKEGENMNSELNKKINDLMIATLQKIYFFDIFKDEVFCYEQVNGELKEIEKYTFAEYINIIETNIQENYLKDFMNNLSIPKLEEQLNSDDYIIYYYKTLNNREYKNIYSLVENEGRKCILVINEKLTGNKINENVSNDFKYNTLLDNVSDSMLKINNIFNLESKAKKNVDAIEEYINSVFGNLFSIYPDLRKSINKNAGAQSSLADGTILIVDDDLVTRNMIKKLFVDEYKIQMAANGKEAIEYLENNFNKSVTSKVDNILSIFLDLTMPVLDGFAVLEYLSKKNYLSKIPVVIISGDYEKDTKNRVYNYNIADMLEKPFDFQIVRHRIGNFINLYKSSNSLSNIINDQNNDLKDIINAFVYTYKFDYSDNIKMVKKYVEILANQVKEDYEEYKLNNSLVNKMVEAAEYYDIGFYSIPRKLLNKRGNLTEEELVSIKDYPLFGSKMINYVFNEASDTKLKDYTNEIATYYHENFDGSGYPCKLEGEKIPLSAQIASIAITYYNLSKKGKDKPEDVIISKSGVMFNPKIVGSFMKVLEKFKEVK